MILERHARMRLALELIARRARISIVHRETHIARERLRAIYRELHDSAPPSGQLPTLGGATINTRRRQVQASLFATLYLRCHGRAPSEPVPRRMEPNIHTVIAAHDLCRVLVDTNNALDITQCWIISRDLHIGTAQFHTCHTCDVHYLVTEYSRFDRTCPICAIYNNRFSEKRAALSGEKSPEAAVNILAGTITAAAGTELWHAKTMLHFRLANSTSESVPH